MRNRWEELQGNAETRRAKLIESHKHQRFLKDFHDLSSWLSSAHTQASSDELAGDVSGAEELIKQHQELQTEVDARKQDVESLQGSGEAHIQEGKYGFGSDIEEKIVELTETANSLDAQMIERLKKLQECLQLQAFNRNVDQAGVWIGMREAAITGDDIGDTLDAVEASHKKHTDLTKSINVQERNISNIQQEADALVAAAHYNSDSIAIKKDDLSARLVLHRWLQWCIVSCVHMCLGREGVARKCESSTNFLSASPSATCRTQTAPVVG